MKHHYIIQTIVLILLVVALGYAFDRALDIEFPEPAVQVS